MNMTTVLDPRLETFLSLSGLVLRGGDETPQFDAKLVIKGKEVAHVKNIGRGGCNIYHWTAPFNRQWAEEKLYPLAAKVATVKEPQFKDLYAKSQSTALDSLVFDEVEKEREKRTRSRRAARDESEAEFMAEARMEMENEGLHERMLDRGTFRSPPGAPTRKPLIDLPPVPPWNPLVPAGITRGAKVYFGRPNGEKTLGKVVKVNNKSVTVETLEERGRGRPVGQKWRVHVSMLTLA